jgi:CheY-like chemotaxis protein
MDGWTVARRLKEQPQAKCPLLVALTGYGEDCDRSQSEESGIDVHLAKPVNLTELRVLLVSRARD